MKKRGSKASRSPPSPAPTLWNQPRSPRVLRSPPSRRTNSAMLNHLSRVLGSPQANQPQPLTPSHLRSSYNNSYRERPLHRRPGGLPFLARTDFAASHASPSRVVTSPTTRPPTSPRRPQAASRAAKVLTLHSQNGADHPRLRGSRFRANLLTSSTAPFRQTRWELLPPEQRDYIRNTFGSSQRLLLHWLLGSRSVEIFGNHRGDFRNALQYLH